MEPVLGGRDDAPLVSVSCTPTPPQWSPSLADGTTRLAALLRGVPRAAAMEPVLGGRDDLGDHPGLVDPGAAAMEPVLGGRDDSLRWQLSM